MECFDKFAELGLQLMLLQITLIQHIFFTTTHFKQNLQLLLEYVSTIFY